MQKRTKIGHFLKQFAIIEPNIKERLDRYQEINNMTGFTVGGKLVETVQSSLPNKNDGDHLHEQR